LLADNRALHDGIVRFFALCHCANEQLYFTYAPTELFPASARSLAS